MNFEELMDKVVAEEWEMFHNVNGDTRVSCQNDKDNFIAMRKAQFSAWSQETVESYLADVEAAKAAGRNLMREKYIRMMRITDPVGYEHFKTDLPPVDETCEKLTEEIWQNLLEQTQRMRQKYPILAMGGRSLNSGDEEDSAWASIETYQKSELLTYSAATLKALLAHLLALKAQGVDLAVKIQENSVTALGYKSLEEADKAMMVQLMEAMSANQGGGCCCCQ